MKWKNLRDKYPDSWVLFEAVQAHSTDGKRFIDELAVLDTFKDSDKVIESYRNFHKKDSERELYVAHTKKQSLEIEERRNLTK